MSVDPLWTFARCAEDEALALAGELGIQRTTAEVLIRRGHTSPEGARAFMEQDGPAHDAFLLGDMEAACDRIEQAIASGERICVHGDYDVDGICATALAVQVLEELGAHVEWHLPSRFEEGYGVGVQALERVAASGVRLLLTVDCGITAVTEVERARELGMDVIITDHHRPGRRCRMPCGSPPAHRTTRSRSCAAAASSSSSPRPCTVAQAAIRPTSSGTSTWSPWPPSRTSSRCSTRTAGSSAQGCAGSPARRVPACGR